jgi:hypothetical protein
MPTDKPRLPRDTHARLVAGPDANRHMPIVGLEVAEYRQDRARVGSIIRAGLELSVLIASLGVMVLVGMAIS